MKVLSKFSAAIYNKVWHTPKGKLRNFLKTKCDDIPQGNRMTVVAVLLSVFVLIAFFLFGNACYRIGLEQAKQRIEDIEHIEAVELPTPAEKLTTLPVYDDRGTEIESEWMVPTEE